jgi:predicted glutamine amidotransferase
MTAGTEPVQATFWLLDAPDSLVAQSHHNADGTGLGYFDPDGTPHVDKQPIAAFEDRQFAAQAREVWSRTFVSHVRHATAGGLTTVNTHPFCQHDRLFAHNGVVNDIPTLEEHLGAERELIAGESDSERYFALITGEIDRHDGDVGSGIRAAVKWIAENLAIVSINFVLITATDLWALRYPEIDSLFLLERSAGGGDAGSPQELEQNSSHGTRVHSAHARDRPVVIVASERLDDDTAWREIPSGELVHVDPSLSVTTERLFTEPPQHTPPSSG